MKELPEVYPQDEYNNALLMNTHPPDWVNPEPAPRYNLVVIGAGTAGLVTAAGAAGLGAKVALVERHLMGGDCLNYGCVPSKAIIRSSRIMGDIHMSDRFGIKVPEGSRADFPRVMERMRRLRTRISFHDSTIRFRDELGVDVFLGEGRFTGMDTIEVNGKTLRFKKAVITTGARPFVPTIEGLDDAGFLTNETIFSLTERPEHLVIIGGGPIGCEMAQTFIRLGSRVTMIEKGIQFLHREDSDAAELLADVFKREGINILLNTKLKKVTAAEKKKLVHAEIDGCKSVIEADEILVGAGRSPNVKSLNLESAGVAYDNRKGVFVNDHLQTTNPRIYAAGDVCSSYKFTHIADASARLVIQNALFRGRKKFSALTIPWCTYTDPEIAHVGMYARETEARGITVNTFKKSFEEVDRAIVDGEEEGFVKIHVKKGTDKILGATVVARHAGEMISEITLAMVGKVGLGTIANVIHPYPTQAEAIRQVGDAYNRTRLTPFVKGLLEKWLTWQCN